MTIFRRSFRKILAALAIIVFLSNSTLPNMAAGWPYTFANVAEPPDNTTPQVKSTEQRLLEEILALDSRVLALQKEVNELSARNNELKKQLSKKRDELSTLDSKVKDRQKKLSRWIVFSFKGGLGNFLAVLVGAEDMGDFFRRLDNIVFIMEYYNTMIAETKSLISQRKQEEFEIMEKQKQIQILAEQARSALEKIRQTIAEKQRELANARMVLKDISFLEKMSKNWQETLPSLDYLLRNLSSLPWNSVGPDDLKVNWFALTARAEFKDTSLTRKLLSGDEKLKNVFFTFSPQGITVSEKKPESSVPLYSITCDMELTEEQKIKFTPKVLEFNGVTLPPDVIKELMKDYNLEFTPPPLPQNLKITSISTEEGKLIMYLKR